MKRVTEHARLVVIGVMTTLLSLALSGVAHAAWNDDNCGGSSWTISAWSRIDASNYVQPADKEGYEWGGGCFRLNDVDDTPYLPTDGSGEGTDCSGLVFKTWALRTDGDVGYRYWSHQKDQHGPYNTASFYSPASGDPFKTIPKTYASTLFMDALVHRDADSGHIALIYAEGSGGIDYVAHSYTNGEGTLIEQRDFRSQSIYKAVSRKNWSPDCYPRCG
jgi:hypothetical protein